MFNNLLYFIVRLFWISLCIAHAQVLNTLSYLIVVVLYYFFININFKYSIHTYSDELYTHFLSYMLAG